MATEPTRRLPFVLLAALPLAAARAQELRKALLEADLVAVAREVGKDAAGPELALHRLQIVAGVRGVPAGATAVVVLDWPGLALHNRPVPEQQRLYCLQDATAAAKRAGLPDDGGPYFRMSGWAGSNPPIGQGGAADPVLRLARLLAATEQGADPVTTAAGLVELAMQGAPEVRIEATRLLAERPDLRTRIPAMQWSTLLARVSGEVDDVPYKIALAELCAEQGLPGLAEALVVGIGPVRHVDYLRTVGRLLAHLRGESATPMLLERVQMAREPKDRQALLLALGATQTDSALDALLNLRSAGADPAVDAALGEHKSRRARAAVQKRDDK